MVVIASLVLAGWSWWAAASVQPVGMAAVEDGTVPAEDGDEDGDEADVADEDDEDDEDDDDADDTLSRIRGVALTGWIFTGTGLGLVGMGIALQLSAGYGSPLGVVGGALTMTGLFVNTIGGHAVIKDIPSSLRPRPARIVANVTFITGAAIGCALVVAGMFDIFALFITMGYAEPPIPWSTLGVMGNVAFFTLAASAVIGLIDSSILIGELQDQAMSSSDRRAKRGPRWAVIHTTTGDGAGAMVIARW